MKKCKETVWHYCLQEGIVLALTLTAFFWGICLPQVLAGPLEDYEDAHLTCLFAEVSWGAYGDRHGALMLDELKSSGWEIQSFFKQSTDADAKFFLAQRNLGGKNMYLLSVAGTESKKDGDVDLKFGKVYFAGKTIAEHEANAAIPEKEVPPGSPMVHRGFLKYVETAFGNKTGDENNHNLINALLKDKTKKVYLVGHSLGGAVATLGGAYLLDLGVLPEQINVITFGAPPVGNDAFVEKYGSLLNVTRIVNYGDPVPTVLQDMVGGYKQMGNEVVWELADDYGKMHHKISLYLDYALKDLYYKKALAEKAGLLAREDQTPVKAGEIRIYVAPVENRLPDELRSEFPTMKEFLLTEYRDTLPGYIIEQGVRPADSIVSDYIEKAAAAGCQGLIMPYIAGTASKTERNNYYVSVQQEVFRVADRQLLSAEALGSNIKVMTPLESLAHGVIDMSETQKEWLPKLSPQSDDRQKKNVEKPVNQE